MRRAETLTQLHDAIRRCIDEVLDAGSATTAEIRDRVAERHAALVAQHGRRLALDKISDLIRRQLRKIEVTAKAASEQLQLPGVLKHLKLAAVISIPPEGGDEDSDDVLWVPWRRATLQQGLRHLQLLDDGIRRDIRRRDAWRDVCDYVAAKTDGDLDAVIGDVLIAHADVPLPAAAE